MAPTSCGSNLGPQNTPSQALDLKHSLDRTRDTARYPALMSKAVRRAFFHPACFLVPCFLRRACVWGKGAWLGGCAPPGRGSGPRCPGQVSSTPTNPLPPLACLPLAPSHGSVACSPARTGFGRGSSERWPWSSWASTSRRGSTPPWTTPVPPSTSTSNTTRFEGWDFAAAGHDLPAAVQNVGPRARHPAPIPLPRNEQAWEKWLKAGGHKNGAQSAPKLLSWQQLAQNDSMVDM